MTDFDVSNKETTGIDYNNDYRIDTGDEFFDFLRSLLGDAADNDTLEEIIGHSKTSDLDVDEFNACKWEDFYIGLVWDHFGLFQEINIQVIIHKNVCCQTSTFFYDPIPCTKKCVF